MGESPESIMTPPLTIAWATRGELIDAPSLLDSTGVEPYMILRRCNKASFLDSFYCETHRCNLANVAQVEMHVQTGGAHRIAVWCNTHRLYEAVTPIPDLQAVAL